MPTADDILRKHAIRDVIGSYSPEPNGIAERANQMIINGNVY